MCSEIVQENNSIRFSGFVFVCSCLLSVWHKRPGVVQLTLLSRTDQTGYREWVGGIQGFFRVKAKCQFRTGLFYALKHLNLGKNKTEKHEVEI
jgi:hypothetical protein